MYNIRFLGVVSIVLASCIIVSGCGWSGSGSTQTGSIASGSSSTDLGSGSSGSGTKDFVISIKRFGDFKRQTIINKQGIIQGSQEITVSSQAAGRVSALPVKEGRSVGANQLVVGLSDGIANYRSQLQRAKIALDSADTTYQNTRINLDKQLSDLQLALDRAKNDFETIQDTTQQQLKKAAQDLKNADYLKEGTPSNLTYKNAQLSILNSLDSLNQTYTVQRTNALQNIDTVIQQTDSLLGLTDKYKLLNDSYEIYLGAKAIQTKYDAEQQLLQLYELKSAITELPRSASTSSELKQLTDQLSSSYPQVTAMIDQMITVLRNSVDSGTPAFNQTAINGFISAFQGLKTASQGGYSGITAFSNSVNSLLSSEQNPELGSTASLQLQTTITNLKVAKENAEIGYNNTLISTKDALFKAELGVTTATSNLQNAQRTKQNQLELLLSSKEQAQVAYQDAQRQLARLSVTSPIAGTIGSLLVDVGQEVSPGTPLFTISSTINQQIEVYLTKEELTYVRVGQSALVEYNQKPISGSIASISNVADNNLNYKAIIVLSRPVSTLGSSVQVYIPIATRYPLVPINAVIPGDQDTASLSVLVGTGIETKSIKIGSTWGDKIEVVGGVSLGTRVIISPIDNYDPLTFTLKPTMVK